MYPSNTSYHIRQECGPCPCPHLLRHPHHQRGKTEGGAFLSSTIQRMNLKCQSQVLEFYRPFSHTFSRNLCLSFVLSKRTVFSKAIMLETMLTAIICGFDLVFADKRKYCLSCEGAGERQEGGEDVGRCHPVGETLHT